MTQSLSIFSFFVNDQKTNDNILLSSTFSMFLHFGLDIVFSAINSFRFFLKLCYPVHIYGDILCGLFLCISFRISEIGL